MIKTLETITAACLCLASLAAGVQAESPLSERSDLRGMFSLDMPEDLSAASGPASLSYEESLDETEYTVGPGDEFQIFAGKNYNLKVNPESYLAFPGLPPVNLGNTTLAEAKVKIKAALGRDFKKDLVYVNIRQVKSIKVAVLGDVILPGIYTLPGNTRLSEYILKAGGFSKTALVPMVQILRRDSTRTEYDLGDYYRSGNLAQNPFLKIGERVFVAQVDMAQPKIELLMGNASFYYQLRSPKRLGEIITEIAGFTRPFDLRAARLNSGRVLVGREILEYAPKGSDVIEFLGRDMKVYVEGEVGRPLPYPFVPGQSPRDYIAEAGLTMTSQRKGKVRVVRVDGTIEDVDIASSRVNPGDHIFVGRSGYANFKEGLLVVSSIATVLFSTIYLVQTVTKP